MESTYKVTTTKHINRYDDEGIMIGSNILLQDSRIYDHTKSQEAHRDGIQINNVRSWARYALGETRNVNVLSNLITAKDSQMQGITFFDGLLYDATIMYNTILINSAHKITLNGLMNGEIGFNKGRKNEVITVQLNPARIGGGKIEGELLPHVWVAHWTDRNYELIKQRGVFQCVEDNRNCIQPTGITVTDFNYRKFIEARPYERRFNNQIDYINSVRQIALDCSKILS